MILPCSSGWCGTHYTDQAVLKLAVTLLPLPSEKLGLQFCTLGPNTF